MKTLPFDLEKALAGHPLVTRSGAAVRNFRRRTAYLGFYFCAAEVRALNGSYWVVTSFTGQGEYSQGQETGADLFLLVEDAQPDIEAQVCQDIRDRQQKGLAKYGTSVADNPLPLKAWLQHAYEECLDQAIYIKRAMAELPE